MLRAGTLVEDRYRVLSVEDRGEAVLRVEAVHRVTFRPVAIRVYPAMPAGHGQATMRRFNATLRRLAAVRHPHLCPIVDGGHLADDRPYAVYELPDGVPLAEVLERDGALPPADAVALMVQVLDALALLHQLGLEHAAVGPRTLYVVPGGLKPSAMLTELGVASLLDAVSPARRAAMRAGQVQDSAYRSPSQLDHVVSPRADLYAWGVLLLECLTGEPAVKGSPLDVMRQVGSGVPVPIPASLQGEPLGEIIRRATNKVSARRYQTAAQIYRDLTSDRPLTVPPEPTAVEALSHQLATLTEQGKHAHALAVIDQLCVLEPSPQRVAQFCFVGATLCRDELRDALRAVEYFDQALDHDVDAMRAFIEAERLLHAERLHKPLARFYRRMIARLEQADPGRYADRMHRLWVRLARLSQRHLRSERAARSALDHALELRPDDEEASALLAGLGAVPLRRLRRRTLPGSGPA